METEGMAKEAYVENFWAYISPYTFTKEGTVDAAEGRSTTGVRLEPEVGISNTLSITIFNL
jgi:hypothetical protein